MKKFFLASIITLFLGLAATTAQAQPYYYDGYYSDCGYGGCGYSCGSCYTCNTGCNGCGGVFGPVGFLWW